MRDGYRELKGSLRNQHGLVDGLPTREALISPQHGSSAQIIALPDSRLTVLQVNLDSGGRQRVSQAESPIGARVLVLTEDLPRPVFGCLSFTTMVLASKMFPDI